LTVANRRHGIGRARAGSDEGHAHPAARPGVPGSHEARTLLGRGNDEPDLFRRCASLVVAEDGVVGRKDGAAAVAEDGIDALVGQNLDDGVRTVHGGAGQWMRWMCSRLLLPRSARGLRNDLHGRVPLIGDSGRCRSIHSAIHERAPLGGPAIAAEPKGGGAPHPGGRRWGCRRRSRAGVCLREPIP
jgi:hypothetical protein